MVDTNSRKLPRKIPWKISRKIQRLQQMLTSHALLLLYSYYLTAGSSRRSKVRLDLTSTDLLHATTDNFLPFMNLLQKWAKRTLRRLERCESTEWITFGDVSGKDEEDAEHMATGRI